MRGVHESRSADEVNFLAELGGRVRHMRAVRGMSRKVLSRVSGLSERYIAQLESGRGNVSITLLRRVAAAIGIAVEDLVSDDRTGPAEWRIIRELLKSASETQIAEARAVLAGARPGREDGSAGADRRVALIGLRGAGKSTLGRIVSERFGWPFVELNAEIERRNGLSVGEIFAIYGQEGYRKFEGAALREVAARPGPLILATGGGIVAEPLTFEMLLSSFFTIWLRAGPEEHMSRVRGQGDFRPMADDRAAMGELKAILASREPFYARANVTVETSGVAADRAAERLGAAIAGNVPGLRAGPDFSPDKARKGVRDRDNG